MELLDHGVSSVDKPKLFDSVRVVNGIVDGGAGGASGSAVHADVDGVAGPSGVVSLSSVKLAGLLGDAILVDELVNGEGIATVAAVVVHVAVEHGLDGEVDLLGGGVTTAETDAVGKGGGGREDVASSALRRGKGRGGGRR